MMIASLPSCRSQQPFRMILQHSSHQRVQSLSRILYPAERSATTTTRTATQHLPQHLAHYQHYHQQIIKRWASNPISVVNTTATGGDTTAAKAEDGGSTSDDKNNATDSDPPPPSSTTAATTRPEPKRLSEVRIFSIWKATSYLHSIIVVSHLLPYLFQNLPHHSSSSQLPPHSLSLSLSI